MVRVIVLSATFNNILAISWRSVFLVHVKLHCISPLLPPLLTSAMDTMSPNSNVNQSIIRLTDKLNCTKYQNKYEDTCWKLKHCSYRQCRLSNIS